MNSRLLLIIIVPVIILFAVLAFYYHRPAPTATEATQPLQIQQPVRPQAQPAAPVTQPAKPVAPPTLQSMRDNAKRRLDMLEAMTIEEWNARQGVPPPSEAHPLETLRSIARKRYEALQAMSEEQWKAGMRNRGMAPVINNEGESEEQSQEAPQEPAPQP